MSSVSKAFDLSQSTDTKTATIAAIGNAIDKIDLLHGKVLLAIYIAPEKTKGGIIRTSNNVKEDVWQGCVGLVMKKGPLAFQDDATTTFGGSDVKIHQWACFVPGDGKRIQINGVDCRVIDDSQIFMSVDDPEIVTHYK